MASKKMDLITKVLAIGFAIVSGSIIFMSVVRLVGYDLTMTSCTPSMKPNITCFCPVLIKRYNNNLNPFTSPDYYEIKTDVMNDVKVGDVIHFYDSFGTTILHRVIEYPYSEDGLKEYCVFTKGDYNSENDGCVEYERIIGKLVWKGC